MERTRRGVLLLSMLAVTGIFCLSGCGGKTESTDSPSYGIADTEKVIKSHPKYGEYLRMESEYKQLAAQYEEQRRQMIRLATQEQNLRTVVQNRASEQSAENEWRSKVAEKERELNRQLRQVYENNRRKHTRTGEESASVSALSAEERIRMANIHLKLTTLGLSVNEREQAQAELQELLQAGVIDSFRDTNNWTGEEIQNFLSLKRQYNAELEAYAAQMRQDIQNREDKEAFLRLTAERESFDNEHEAWARAWKTKLENQQKAMAAVKGEIMKDIREDAAAVAEEHGLDMIFSQYRVNIHATDVTNELESKIVNIKQ